VFVSKRRICVFLLVGDSGVEKVKEWLRAIDVLVVGPGLGRDEFILDRYSFVL
jgi:hypothetical protein